MHEPRVLTTGIAFGESPRWHDGRIWLSDWAAGELLAVAPDGAREVMAKIESFPFCFDRLPGGRLLVVNSAERRVMLEAGDGSFTTYADLGAVSQKPWNEIVVDGRGNAYVNNIGFDFGSEEPAPGVLVLVTPDGAVRQVADGLMFPNGMAVTPDGSTLLVAESYASCLTAFDIGPDGGLSNRRVWASLGDAHPDGICVDAEGAVWLADVGLQCCLRVAEGGEVLARVEAGLGCFACMLGGPDGRTLYVVAQAWPPSEERTGQVLTVTAPAPAAGWPASR